MHHSGPVRGVVDDPNILGSGQNSGAERLDLQTESREVLVLREIEDLSYKHIAAVLDLPIGTVMSRIARAREKLAVELKGRLERRDHGLPDL